MFSTESHHGRIEEDKHGWAQESRGAQEVCGVGQTQERHKGSPCQQRADWGCFIQPLAIIGADVDQLEGGRVAHIHTSEIQLTCDSQHDFYDGFIWKPDVLEQFGKK